MSAVPTGGLRAMEILPDVVGTVTTKPSLTDKANGGGKKKNSFYWISLNSASLNKDYYN